MKTETLRQLLADRQAKRPAVMVRDLETGEARIAYPPAAGDPAEAEIVRAAREDKSRTVEVAGRRLFLHVFNPPLRMLVVGAVHIAQPLARMAALTGYDVTVVDPRGAFASEERFPGVALSTEWPDEALETLAPDTRTAVVTLTHDPKLDDPALAVALRSPAFYIGALGSPRTHARRVGRLRELGLGDNEIARIRGPVGLDIGAKSPPEIAISIMAQVTQVLREKAA